MTTSDFLLHDCEAIFFFSFEITLWTIGYQDMKFAVGHIISQITAAFEVGYKMKSNFEYIQSWLKHYCTNPNPNQSIDSRDQEFSTKAKTNIISINFGTGSQLERL